ncbi:MAG: hypothetical protein M1840_005153 [Geoglossum simile]|nr:MAG: hypothetical protein M1840_005153 [Geoglossum simile]
MTNIPSGAGAVGRGWLEELELDAGMVAGIPVGLPWESVVRMKVDPESGGAGAGNEPDGGVVRGVWGLGGAAVDEEGSSASDSRGGGADDDDGEVGAVGVEETSTSEGSAVVESVTAGTTTGGNPVIVKVTGTGFPDPAGGGVETIVNTIGSGGVGAAVERGGVDEEGGGVERDDDERADWGLSTSVGVSDTDGS